MSVSTDDATLLSVIDASYKRPRTREDYKERLTRMKVICDGASIHTILSNPDQYYKILKAKYPKATTRKSMLTAVLALFKCMPELRETLHGQHQKWIGYHKSMDELINFHYASNEQTTAQAARYTSYEEIRLKYISMLKGPDPHGTRASSQQVVWLSILLAYPPKRADYASFRIYPDKDPNKTGENYLVYRRDTKVAPSLCVFTTYKTDSKYGKIVEAVPARLQRDISNSLTRHPRRYLFVNRSGDPFASNTLFSQYIIHMSQELFGRPSGVTDFRHAYINTLDQNASSEYLQDIATRMMHDNPITTQKLYVNRR